MKQNKIILEIRASEGGQDSKLLVEELTNIYLKSARLNNFTFEISDQRPGICAIWLTGKGVKEYYTNESGCHRFIRIPPTENRGRTHTSVISVAITEPSQFSFNLDRSKVSKSYISSSGKGGQNVNRRSTCVQLTDEITGIQVKVQDKRTQPENEVIAWKRLEEKIRESHKENFNKKIYQDRFNQVGNSSRSTKKRTYRIKEDTIIDHESGKVCSYKDFSRGKIELLS